MSSERCPSNAADAAEAERKGSSSSSHSSSTFLASENLCGQTLLNLVGNGHSILADIRILSERVPSAFWAAASLELGRDSSGKNKKDAGASKKSAGDSADQGFLNLFHTSSSTSNSSSKGKDVRNVDFASDDNNGSSSSKKNDMEEGKKYAPFLFDFSYLHNPEEWEASLALLPSKEGGSNNQEHADPLKAKDFENLLELEREFAVNQRQSIEEFYELFFSIYDYQKELNQFVEDLNKGFYIQYTVESVLLDLEGRALLCEAVWLYGVMLIMMERLLPVRYLYVNQLSRTS